MKDNNLDYLLRNIIILDVLIDREELTSTEKAYLIRLKNFLLSMKAKSDHHQQ